MLLVTAGALLSRPYARMVDVFPELRRTPVEVSTFSPVPQSFLAAPAQNHVWGAVTEDVRSTLRQPVEQTLFPGLAILLLAVIGLSSRVYPPELRAAVAIATIGAAVLSLGLHVGAGPVGDLMPYRLLYELGPGWQGIRTPGRINTLTSLGLALLAAAGSQQLAMRARLRRGNCARGAAVAVAIGLILVEGSGRLLRVNVPRPAASYGSFAEPQLHLPTDYADFDALHVFWSTNGFPSIVNGIGPLDPPTHRSLRKKLESFPDAETVRTLRRLGVRTVVLHRNLSRGTPWQGVAARNIRGLQLTRAERGPLVIYTFGGRGRE